MSLESFMAVLPFRFSHWFATLISFACLVPFCGHCSDSSDYNPANEMARPAVSTNRYFAPALASGEQASFHELLRLERPFGPLLVQFTGLDLRGEVAE